MVAFLILVAQSGCKERPACGNGIVERGEECDGEVYWSLTCADVIPGSTGILACRSTCTFDMTLCDYCGNGRMDEGETCDCGTDPSDLPPACGDVNGGPNGYCTSSCIGLVEHCGDGVVDPVWEECDCGTVATPLPAGCTDVNGGPDGTCSIDCEEYSCDVVGYGLGCDPLTLDSCCKDDWGIRPVCAGDLLSATCARECADTLDCFWGFFCDAAVGNLCQPEVCGPVGGWPNTEVNAFCTVSGGGSQGWCAPVTPRLSPTDPSMGLCVEGTLDPGAPCRAIFSGTAPDSTRYVDRSEDTCRQGFCRAIQAGDETGVCAQYCDWEAAYAVAFYRADPGCEALPCPQGSNCFAQSSIDAIGIRSGDLGYCVPTSATDPFDGVTACSLVTGRLLSSPNQTCEEIGSAGDRCVAIGFPPTLHPIGSLLGSCVAPLAEPNLAVWDSCDPADASDVCPPGSICEQPDVFATTPILAARCVPVCDTEHPAGTQPHCADLGAVPTTDGTPFCQSMSLLFPPGGPLDIMPTRLGLCGL